MSTVDLHSHSTASDGRLSPTELVDEAVRRGVAVLALTDHDTMAGVPEALAAASRAGVQLIPGVELNTDAPKGELHVLGYLLSGEEGPFAELLQARQNNRRRRAHEMVEKLRALGVPVDMEAVERFAGGGVIGRPHVGRALVEAGHVAHLGEAFDKYIDRHGPAYVKRDETFTAVDAIKVILAAGGVPVLAHPGRLADEAYIGPLIEAGLQGIECYYPDHTPEQTARYIALAKAHDLIVTGGSDFHGDGMHAPLGSVAVPEEAAEQLYERQRRLAGRAS